MNALKNYSQKLVELNLFRKNNAQLFLDYENLQDELKELEVELREEVKEKGDEQNEFVKATRVERWKKYYDYDLFVSRASKLEKSCLEKAKGIITEIRKDVFDELNKQGIIKDKTKQTCFKEELLNVAVIIKQKI